MESAAIKKEEKSITELSYEDVFGSEPDDPKNPSTYAGIFEKLVGDAGGFEACTSEQLAEFHETACRAVETAGQ